MRRRIVWLISLIVWVPVALSAGEAEPNTLTEQEKKDGFVLLFDGKSLDGWKAAENPKSFSVVDGKIVADGPRAHLFYVGDVCKHNFKNFELRLRVFNHPKANGGVFFHAVYQEKGWPLKQGYEAQVNNTYKDPKKTGSIYNYNNVMESPVNDDEWWDYTIRVTGRKIATIVNGKVVAEYAEPENDPAKHRLKGGTFALQCHDPKSKVEYHTIRVRVLPDVAK